MSFKACQLVLEEYFLTLIYEIFIIIVFIFGMMLNFAQTSIMTFFTTKYEK